MLQDIQRVFPARQGAAQGGREAFENGGLTQEVAHRTRLAFQHLGHQVVHDIAVVSGKGGHEFVGRLRMARASHRLAQGNPGKLEPGDPPLGAR